MNSVARALDLYYDRFGQYPSHTDVNMGVDCAGWRGSSATGNTFLKTVVDAGFLGGYVESPNGGANCGGYQYRYRQEKSGQAYRIIFLYETKPNNDSACYDNSPNPPVYSCIRMNFDDRIE